MLFTDACSDSSYAGHRLQCPLLTTLFVGAVVRLLVGYTKTQQSCWVTCVVFSDACSDSSCAGHHLQCPLLTTLFVGAVIRLLVGYTKTQQSCWVTCVVFSDACSDSTCTGHHLQCPLLTTLFAKLWSQAEWAGHEGIQMQRQFLLCNDGWGWGWQLLHDAMIQVHPVWDYLTLFHCMILIEFESAFRPAFQNTTTKGGQCSFHFLLKHVFLPRIIMGTLFVGIIQSYLSTQLSLVLIMSVRFSRLGLPHENCYFVLRIDQCNTNINHNVRYRRKGVRAWTSSHGNKERERET